MIDAEIGKIEPQLRDLEVSAAYLATVDITSVSDEFLEEMVVLLDSLGLSIIESKDIAKHASKIANIVFPELDRRQRIRKK